MTDAEVAALAIVAGAAFVAVFLVVDWQLERRRQRREHRALLSFYERDTKP